MVTGIICELNPLHSGHKYLFDAVKQSEKDAVVCCMSGNFVQRGEFAVYDKFTRARSALENGADLVIELPAAYSTLSAEGFCRAGVNLLEATGIVDRLAFGAENDAIAVLKEIADQLLDKEIQRKITEEMKSGISFAAARSRVLDTDLLDYPNNILAVEYLKATKLPCLAVKRIGKGHDTDDEEYSSSAIRSKLSGDEISSMKNCEIAVLSKLRTMTAQDFLKITDVSEGLENRIIDAVRNATMLDELYDMIKSKRYAHSRIRRIILRAYLGIYEMPKEPPYIRILGFNAKGKALLSEMKKNASKPIVTKLSDCDSSTLPFYEQECGFTDLYNLGYKLPRPCGTEQRSKIILI
ncbi:MAG: nucleotidyltransferase family protein [Eubacterium sp.]|nr:nucleotidyltransferase family protein [Eubacterium sp.]